jgi:hypothetical protein
MKDQGLLREGWPRGDEDRTGALLGPLASLTRVDACDPLLQAHPTWARDEHEGRGISTSLTPVSGRLASPLRARPRARPIWAGARGTLTRRLRGPPVSKRRHLSTTTYCARVASELDERYSKCVFCHRCRHKHICGVVVATLGLCFRGHGFKSP